MVNSYLFSDTVMLNWYKPLVEQFKGYPLCIAPSISDYFQREVEHVRDFDKRVSELEPREAQQAFQKVLLLGLGETRVGLYSKFHDAAVYELGYAHPTAIHLAYMSVSSFFFWEGGTLLKYNLGLPLAWMQARLDSESSNMSLMRIDISGELRNPGIHGN